MSKLLQRLPAWGQYSDDTQMTREMCSVIAEHACLAPDAYAGRMLRLYEKRALCGAGSTTKGALLRFANGVPWNQLAPKGGRPSNGCAMRVGTCAPGARVAVTARHQRLHVVACPCVTCRPGWPAALRQSGASTRRRSRPIHADTLTHQVPGTRWGGAGVRADPTSALTLLRFPLRCTFRLALP